MDYLGNPQNQLKVIHVAGTSGKTSTSYYAAALLAATGKKVGLTVSPHIAEINERVQINLLPMPEAEFCKELSEFLALIETSQINPSWFEFLIAFDYWEFAKQAADYAVVEVGLGGLLDGTNVIDRADKVCIITDIGLDHVRVLGHSLPEIAAQKAGIIQPRNVVFSYSQAANITDIIKNQAEQMQAELHLIVSFSVLNADSRLHDGLQELSHLVDYVITTEFGINQDVHQQSVDTEAVVQACRDIGMHGVEVVKEPIEALKTLLSRPENILLVTGSFYLLNPIRPYVLELEK